MNSVFSEQLLADKLSKLNSTQQCIETLSHLCIFHQSKAELVVATWDKQFHNSEMVQKVPLLYLANDILQNSKRKGNEFVTEFWKVLPAALKDVSDKGDDRGKLVVSRLVTIWEERRVFGSRHRSLKEVMLGEDAPPPLQLSKKRSRSVRILKRDSRAIRTKLSVGGTAEKIVSAFHSVLTELPNEESEMSNCKSAAQRIRKMEKNVDIACANAKDPKRKILAKELDKEEGVLQKCIEKLRSAEASRAALVIQLKETLHEQESELENVRTQMQVAEAQVAEASNMRAKLNDENWVSKPSSGDTNAETGKTPKKTAAAIAAEVADKLTASSSSQMIMHSVLSTFALEEAKNSNFTNNGTMPISSSSVTEPTVFTPTYQSVMVPQQTMQNQASAPQVQYHVVQNLGSQQQYMQPTAGMTSFVYSSNPPPLPPPPLHMLSPMVPVPVPMTHQQSMQMAQQSQGPPTFRPLPPPGMYYTHPHHT